MGRRRIATRGPPGGRSLDALLSSWLPFALGRPVSKGQVRKLVRVGAVHVDERPCRNPSDWVRSGVRVAVVVDEAKLFGVEPGPVRVLYEDRWVIAVDKPPGLPTHPTLDPARPTAVGAVKALLAARGGQNPYLGVHHRLDRDTSGVLLFAKDPAANPALAAAFAERAVNKRYLAVAAGPLLEPRTVRDHLGPLPGSGKRTKHGAVRSGGALAETHFEPLERRDRGTLVSAEPRTGRTHQIRVHLAGLGAPILGDGLYGGPPAARVMLHAARLALPHPVESRSLVVEAEAPADLLGAWNEC